MSPRARQVGSEEEFKERVSEGMAAMMRAEAARLSTSVAALRDTLQFFRFGGARAPPPPDSPALPGCGDCAAIEHHQYQQQYARHAKQMGIIARCLYDLCYLK